jgi:hypothetical protein
VAPLAAGSSSGTVHRGTRQGANQSGVGVTVAPGSRAAAGKRRPAWVPVSAMPVQ